MGLTGSLGRVGRFGIDVMLLGSDSLKGPHRVAMAFVFSKTATGFDVAGKSGRSCCRNIS